MKNVIKCLIIGALIAACQPQDQSAISKINSTIYVENIAQDYLSKRSYGPLIQLQVEYGNLECGWSLINCDCEESDDNTFCKWNVSYRELPPTDFEDLPELWHPCEIFPCGWDYTEPWEYYENVDGQAFGSIKDHFDLEIEQPTADSFIVPINGEMLMVQFYKENRMMGEPSPQPNIYYLNNEVVLNESLAEELGLEGTHIEEGEYPIIYNEENHTFNVVFKVR